MIKLCIICLSLGGVLGGMKTALQTRSNDAPSYSAAVGTEYSFQANAPATISDQNATKQLNPDTIGEVLAAAQPDAVSFSELLRPASE
jgi:hypothetical protein